MKHRKTDWEIEQEKVKQQRQEVREALLRIERRVDAILTQLLTTKQDALKNVHAQALDSLQSARNSLVNAARRF